MDDDDNDDDSDDDNYDDDDNNVDHWWPMVDGVARIPSYLQCDDTITVARISFNVILSITALYERCHSFYRTRQPSDEECRGEERRGEKWCDVW